MSNARNLFERLNAAFIKTFGCFAVFKKKENPPKSKHIFDK